MKTIITRLFFLSVLFHGYGQNTAIPDVNFEKTLIDLGYDTGNPDGLVPTANIDTIVFLDASSKNINDLQGIQDFTALTTLICSDNNITDLKITNNKALQVFHCDNNNINVLNISENTALGELYCNNNALTGLDASKNSNLVVLVAHSNQLTTLNIKNGNNTNILSFDARSNPNLTCIDVDNKAYSTANWTNIDPQTGFSETCGTLGIDNFLNSNISVYPNPTNAVITIDIKNQVEIENVKTFDSLGRRLKSAKASTVDLGNFKPGLYFIKIKTNEGTLIKKVIKI